MRRLYILIKSVALTVFFVLLCASGSIVGAQDDTTYKVGDQIQFGTYPQTKVAETTSLKNAAKLATWKSYDYYCTECGAELTRTSHEIDMLRHVNAEPVKENEISPSCTVSGSYDSVTYCSKCGDELNRETIIVKMLDHTPGSPTEKIVRYATCTAQGEKKIIVRCTECKNILSEITESIPALHHSYVATVTPATCTSVGYTTYICERGDHTYISDYTDKLEHKDIDNDGKRDICQTEMEGDHYCKYCGETHEGFGGFFVGLIHSILALFGLKK